MNRSTALRNALVDCLNITCPSCSIVLDQTPDGCCAVRCPHCATFFCWLCFSVQSNSSKCHAHVPACKLNSAAQKEVFVPQKVVAAAHRSHKIGRMRSAVQTHRTWLGKKEVKVVLKEELIAVLGMNGIDARLVMR